VTELLQGRSLKDLDVFSPPSFDNDDVADLSNLETHFIDSSGLISWDLFNQKSDYEFVDWDFSGTTEQEFANLMAIFDRHQIEVLIMDYQHLGVYACRILAVGMSEIYPPEDLLIANNNMAIHLRDLILSLPYQKHTNKQLLAIIEQFDEEGLDDFARVRELLGIATGKDNAWLTLRVGELKAMLALAAGDLPQAKSWIDWTIEMNESIFSAERNHAYRCLQTLVNFIIERGANQFNDYLPAFNKMYGNTCVAEMWLYATAKKQFFGLTDFEHSVSETNSLMDKFAMHQKLLDVYHKLNQIM